MEFLKTSKLVITLRERVCDRLPGFAFTLEQVLPIAI
jgi:hypothetical protein